MSNNKTTDKASESNIGFEKEIEKARNEKRELEQHISSLILKYEKQYGVTVSKIEYAQISYPDMPMVKCNEINLIIEL
jgi:hypothetical protein